jgi:FixJ family two-component response regulator
MDTFDTSLPWIAVVDDEEPVRRAVLRLLRAAGLPAQGFDGGAALLAAPMHQKPYCVVMDLHMPDMDGIELQRRLAVSMPRSAVIALTGSHSAGTRRRMEQAGALAFLSKPADEEQLLAAIATAWARWHEDVE